jgi:hypothetical protein
LVFINDEIQAPVIYAWLKDFGEEEEISKLDVKMPWWKQETAFLSCEWVKRSSLKVDPQAV